MIKFIKKIVTKIAKKNYAFRQIVRKLSYIYKRFKYILSGLFIKIDDKTIIFCSFSGKKYVDSPKAIYEYMINSKKYCNYKFIWTFREPEDFEYLLKNKNTTLVKKGTRKYYKYMHISKYWIFNYKIPEYLIPKKDQVFVQCWHGTPLKRLGCDLLNYDSELNTPKEMKKRYRDEALKFSYFISPSKYASKSFISAWDLRSINKEKIIIEKGYPRNDFLSNYTKNDVDRIKKELKLPKDKKIILYAPTYRANQHEIGLGYTYKTELDFDKLEQKIGKDYIILFRAHYFVANSFDFNKYKNFIYDVSDYNEINDLYVVSDLLITDYSSVFFDYSILKRPMIFYMYDLEYYKNESNGFYFDIEKELPGPIVKDEDSLIKSIIDTDNFKYDKKYKKFNEKYTYLDDGKASERVVNEIIK